MPAVKAALQEKVVVANGSEPNPCVTKQIPALYPPELYMAEVVGEQGV